MWPDDYIAWAGRFRREVVRWIRRWLRHHLRTNPEWSRARANDLAEQATRHAFDRANDHRRYPEYVRSEAEFRVWVSIVAFNEAIRLLVRHRFGEPRFHLLPADQRRFLGMRYLDQLPPGDVAGVLRVSADGVREQARQALEAFLQILGEPNVEEQS